MQSRLFRLFIASGLLVCLSASAGCAKKDVDRLESELEEVRALATSAKTSGDEALQTAQAANATAADAKQTADAAKATADEAKAMAEDNSARIDRMFKKAVSK